MKITSVKTRRVQPPRDDIYDVLYRSLPKMKENTVLAISSKIVSISQGRCVKQTEIDDKDALAREEAEYYLSRDMVPGGFRFHTITNNLLISSAGIDTSNSDGYYVLWPDEPYKTAKRIRAWLKRKYSIKNIGVIITDSHGIPFRRGLVGVSLGYDGIEPLIDQRGEKDVFGNAINYAQTNVADSLAVASVLVMGEAGQQTPCALISELPDAYFKKQHRKQRSYSTFEVPKEEDVFYPLFKHLPWRKGGKSQS